MAKDRPWVPHPNDAKGCDHRLNYRESWSHIPLPSIASTISPQLPGIKDRQSLLVCFPERPWQWTKDKEMRQIRKLEGSIGRAIIGHNWKAGETLPLKTLGANPPSGMLDKTSRKPTYRCRTLLPTMLFYMGQCQRRRGGTHPTHKWGNIHYLACTNYRDGRHRQGDILFVSWSISSQRMYYGSGSDSSFIRQVAPLYLDEILVGTWRFKSCPDY